jgi:Flp pilus assembly protein TadG
VEAIMKIKSEKLSQSGAVAMEFALVLPMLLLILFGIIEFSVLFYNKAMITNASREGARFGITYPGGGGRFTEPEIQTVVSAYVGNMLISFGNNPTVDVSLSNSGTAAGDNMTVTVEYDYNFLVLPEFVDSIADFTLTAVTVMRYE